MVRSTSCDKYAWHLGNTLSIRRQEEYKIASMNERVTVVIPAYNEGARIDAVLKPLVRARKKGIITDIIVVDDGSTDNTGKNVSNFDVGLIKLEKNMGKGAAMATGISVAQTDIILFLDADLVGLKETHLQKLLFPIVDNKKVGMTIGLFKKSGFVANFGNMLQVLSGQRAVRKSWIKNVTMMEDARYGVDVLVTLYARKHDIKTVRIYLLKLSHVYKEQKANFFVGFFRFRLKMYYEIMKTLAKGVK